MSGFDINLSLLNSGFVGEKNPIPVSSNFPELKQNKETKT